MAHTSVRIAPSSEYTVPDTYPAAVAIVSKPIASMRPAGIASIITSHFAPPMLG